LTRRNPLLHRALIAPQHLCPRRLPDAAQIHVEQKLHLPALKTAALYAALDQFLNDSIELAELYILDQLLFHHLHSGAGRRKVADSVVFRNKKSLIGPVGPGIGDQLEIWHRANTPHYRFHFRGVVLVWVVHVKLASDAFVPVKR
jgi:hypothetical protein